MELCPCMGYVCQYEYDMYVWQCLMFVYPSMDECVCMLVCHEVCVCVCVYACGDISMCMCDMTEYSIGPMWNVPATCSAEQGHLKFHDIFPPYGCYS